MLSGDTASKELSRALQYGDHVTRLDMAVTVRLDPEDTHVETAHYDAYITGRAREGRRAKATLILSDDGGATFYLGKRTSDVMLRVYNKAVESGDARYAGCHRYELEVKGDRAGVTATQLEGAKDTGRFCQESVYDWAVRRGITPMFPSVGGRQLVPGFRRRADVDTKLAWLENQVRPSIHWLTSQGKRTQTLAALDVNGTEVEDTGTGSDDLDAANWHEGGRP
jgi:DNA relaxase NicK